MENIVTTHDELFKAQLDLKYVENIAAKEVQYYAMALTTGFELVSKNRIISNKMILTIHEQLEQNNAGFRKLPGTDLKNSRTNQVVYTPPQNSQEVKKLMENLEVYINNEELETIDPLIKMAIVHHQFESIHPFYDGNGRTGRILNILYLVSKDLLDFPVLYLSRYIIQNKAKYYELLQKVRDEGEWEEWILFMIEGVEIISRQSIFLIQAIKNLMQEI